MSQISLTFPDGNSRTFPRGVTAAELTNPILNSPYSAPEEHFELGPDGPTGTVLPGRRPSESFIPVPAVRKGRGKGAQAELAVQTTLDFDLTGERREQNSLINDIRRQVELWRARNYPGVTPMSRKLLVHWAGTEHDREDRMLFCQREAAETAIYLAEVAGVSNPYLSQIERGLRKPSAEILQQIAKALQISAETLYERAGFMEADRAARGVREAIAADPLLSQEQQQALLNVYESFVGAHRA